MNEFRYVEVDGIVYQVRADRPLPWWAKGARDVTPIKPTEAPEAKAAPAPANKSRRHARAKAVGADA